MQSAHAATPVAQAQGQFLAGSVLGADLASIVSVAPAGAVNTGGAATAQVNPLSVSALNAVNIDLGGGVNLLGNNGILTLGAVNQAAAANPDGSSDAASGAVTDSGAIAVGGSAGAPADATLDLQPLITPALSSALSALTLSTGALSATAQQTAGGTQSGGYQIADLNLTLTSPLVAGVTSGLRASLVALQPAVDALPAAIRALPAVGPLATITGVPDLGTLVDALGTVTSADGSITANLQTGAVTVDVAQLLTTAGLDLNNLPADKELLPVITDGLTSQLLPALTAALNGLVTSLTDAIDGIDVSVLGVPVALSVLAPVLNPVIAQVVAPVNAAVSSLGATVITPLASALSTMLSLRANSKETVGGTFTERALRVGILPGNSPATAIVNLASASVGPNAGPAAAPTATSLTPASGPAAGGQTVTVTGTDFVDGATSVTIGGITVPAADVTVSSPTSLTFSTPAHAAGAVDVTVTTPGGTSGALGYTYLAAPAASALDPTQGPTTGGQTVTVAGTGFVDGATSITIGGITVPAADVTVSSPTSLTFSTPAHAAGAVDVTVTTAGGTSDPALTYTYVTPSAPVPTAASLDPTQGPAAGGQTVTVTGTGFVDGATSVTIGGTTVPATDVTVSSPTSLTFSTPAHAAGPVDVVVTTVNGSSTPALTYTYVAPGAVAPAVSSLAPVRGPSAGGQTVTVTGTGFVAGATSVTIGGKHVAPAAVTVTGTTRLRFVTPAHAAGPVGVTVTTPGGTSSPRRYTYVAARPVAPGAVALTPTRGPASGGQRITVTGSGFVTGSTSVTIGGSRVGAGQVTVLAPTRLRFVSPPHPDGIVRVTVTTAGGTTRPLGYTYLPDAPVIDSPASGATGVSSTPVISGTGRPGARVVVTSGGQVVCTAVVGADGTWQCVPDQPLAAGEHEVQARQTTAAGSSGPSTPVTFSVGADTTGGTDSPPPPLADTGVPATSLLLLAALLLAGGIAALLLGRRRRGVLLSR